MKDILAWGNRPVLADWARRSTLVAFDYDGTLAPIARDPGRAAMRPSTRWLLAAVARRYPCAVISGRALRDLRRLLAGLPLGALVGNHGAEPAPRRLPALVTRWRAALEERLGAPEGIVIEDKGFSLSIHYRAARRRSAARRAILREAVELPRARVTGGKCVVNVVPEGAPHKGTALMRVMDDLGCEAAIYVGDDETDEDVFSLGPSSSILAVCVGAGRRSRAAYRLRRQSDFDRLLEELVGHREPDQFALRCRDDARDHGRGDPSTRPDPKSPFVNLDR